MTTTLPMTHRADVEILVVECDGDRVKALTELVRQLEHERESNGHLDVAAVWFDERDNVHAALDEFRRT